MILTCPQCATHYRADAAILQPGVQSVRCAKCGKVWSAPSSATARDAAAKTASGDATFKSAQPPDRSPGFRGRFSALSHTGTRSRLFPVPTWLLLFAAAAAIAWSAGEFTAAKRDQSLSLEGVRYSMAVESGKQILRVRGTVLNSGPRGLVIPSIEAALLDVDGHKIDGWEFDVQPSVLAAHGEADFITERVAPSASRQFALAFATRKH